MAQTERPPRASDRAPQPLQAPRPDGDALKQQAGAAAQNLADQAQETAGQVTAQVKQTALSLLDAQKDRVTENLGALSDSLRQASAQLRQSEGGAVFAQYLDTAAARVQGVSTHLDERAMSDLFSDLEGYARRQPAVFLGGMFAVGTLAARFLRSTGAGTSTGGAMSQPTPPRPSVAPAPAPGNRDGGITQPIPPAPMHRDDPDRLAAAYRNNPPSPPPPGHMRSGIEPA